MRKCLFLFPVSITTYILWEQKLRFSSLPEGGKPQMISFASAHPELLSEWDSANTDCQPEKISYGSNRKVSWIGKCGHVWTATIKNRSNGSGCPFCSGNRVLPGFNDLQSQYPELAKEWSKKNEELSPSEVTVKANRKVWWECSTYRAAVSFSSVRYSGLPLLAAFTALPPDLPVCLYRHFRGRKFLIFL